MVAEAVRGREIGRREEEVVGGKKTRKERVVGGDEGVEVGRGPGGKIT